MDPDMSALKYSAMIRRHEDGATLEDDYSQSIACRRDNKLELQ
jgi:hypothetical protein